VLKHIKAMSRREALALVAGHVSIPSIGNAVLHLQNKGEIV
jgi:hypothetical protein